MGRVAEYKDEHIIEVGIELESKGDDVTTSSIRKKLGGGSSTRIKAIWNGFLKQRAELNALDQEKNEVELPAELQSLFEQQSEMVMGALRSYVQKSYSTSEALSEMKVKARIEEYSKRIDRFERAEDEALAEVDACEERILALIDEQTQLVKDNEMLKSNNAELMGQLKRLDESAIKHDAVAVKFEALLKENGRLQYMIDNIKKPSET